MSNGASSMATVSLRDSQDDIPAACAGAGLCDVLSAGVRAVGDPLRAEVPVHTVLVQVVLDVRVLVVVVDVVVQAIVAAGGAIRLLSGPTCCQCCSRVFTTIVSARKGRARRR